CLAVGDSWNRTYTYETLAERWDGRRWTIESIPPLPGSRGFFRATLLGVACSARDACTAIGSGGGRTLAEHWDGRRWAIQTTPNPSSNRAPNGTLAAISCTASHACMAVDWYAQGPKSRTLAERWDGASWRIQPTVDRPTTLSALSDVSCISS